MNRKRRVLWLEKLFESNKGTSYFVLLPDSADRISLKQSLH